VTAAPLDYTDPEAIAEFHSEHGRFAMILGSSLQNTMSVSDGNANQLWKTLDALLQHNNDSIVLLAHAIHSLQVPPPADDDNGLFERIRVVSGNQFGMTTRWGESSDFEISVFARSTAAAKPPKGDDEL
jgi:hypothetical protein